MPPRPPATRESTPETGLMAVAKMSKKKSSFLLLYCSDQAHPAKHLGQSAYDALPEVCRRGLERVATSEHLPDEVRRLLEAYYGAGYRPNMMVSPRTPTSLDGVGLPDVAGDVREAMALCNASDDVSMVELMNMDPGLADAHIFVELRTILSGHDLKAVDKIRLEAIRLALQLKGHLREEKQQVTQATQIVIHTEAKPDIVPQEKASRVDIDL